MKCDWPNAKRQWERRQEVLKALHNFSNSNALHRVLSEFTFNNWSNIFQWQIVQLTKNEHFMRNLTCHPLVAQMNEFVEHIWLLVGILIGFISRIDVNFDREFALPFIPLVVRKRFRSFFESHFYSQQQHVAVVTKIEIKPYFGRH